MLRKSLLALAAVAALGATGLSATDASAKGYKGGYHKGGIHFGIGHYGWRYRHFTPRVVYYTRGYSECYKVVTRRGRVKLVCTY